jgi:hypothetical protein
MVLAACLIILAVGFMPLLSLLLPIPFCKELLRVVHWGAHVVVMAVVASPSHCQLENL